MYGLNNIKSGDIFIVRDDYYDFPYKDGIGAFKTKKKGFIYDEERGRVEGKCIATYGSSIPVDVGKDYQVYNSIIIFVLRNKRGD